MNLNFIFSLNFYELILLISLFIFCTFQLYKSYLKKNWIDIFKPLNLFALLTLFYCVLGPIFSSSQPDGSISYRAINHREYYQTGLLAALISFISFQLGFDYKNNFLIKDYGLNKQKNNKDNKKDYLILYKWGELFFLFTMVIQVFFFGFGFFNKINFLGGFNINSNVSFYQGSFASYFTYTINFLITSILLMLISFFNGNKKNNRLIFYLLITVGIFITYGFRYRLFLLFMPIFLIYFFYKKTKPKIIFLSTLILSTILIFGTIQLTRSYGTGLSIDKLTNNTKNKESIFSSILKASFTDSNIFNTSAGMIYKTPSEYNYVGIAPLFNAISVPIPRRIWPNKPDGEYILKLYKLIYPNKLQEIGAASLGFAEYYISGGWILLISLNFFLGYLYKRIWIWFFCNFYDPLAQINYAIYLSYLYILYSRGYMLQILFLYITIFAPLIWFSYLWNKRFNS